MKISAVYAFPAAAVILLLAASGFSQSIPDVMDGRVRNPFDGLTPDNLSERLRPFLDQAEHAATDEEKARDYVFLTQIVDGRMTDPASQDVVTELANKALQYDLSPRDRMDMLGCKGSAIKKKFAAAMGEELRAPRREIATLWLEGYKVGLTYKTESEVKFKREHPDFNPNKTLNDLLKESPGLGVPRGVWWTGPSPAESAYGKARAQYREIQDMDRVLRGHAGGIADLYVCPPYDFEELRSLTMKVLNDSEFADDLVQMARKEIGASLTKESGWQTQAVNAGLAKDMEVSVSSDVIASPTGPVAIAPTAPAAPPAAEPPVRSRLPLVLAGIAVLLAAFLIALLAHRKGSPKEGSPKSEEEPFTTETQRRRGSQRKSFFLLTSTL